MDKTALKTKKNVQPGTVFIKALLSGAVTFALCILLFPLLLLKSADPAAFVPAVAAASVALTALSSSYAASKNGTNTIIATLVCSAIISALIFLASLAFSGSSETDYTFCAITCGAEVIFSLAGSLLGKKRKVKKNTKRRR